MSNIIENLSNLGNPYTRRQVLKLLALGAHQLFEGNPHQPQYPPPELQTILGLAANGKNPMDPELYPQGARIVINNQLLTPKGFEDLSPTNPNNAERLDLSPPSIGLILQEVANGGFSGIFDPSEYRLWVTITEYPSTDFSGFRKLELINKANHTIASYLSPHYSYDNRRVNVWSFPEEEWRAVFMLIATDCADNSTYSRIPKAWYELAD